MNEGVELGTHTARQASATVEKLLLTEVETAQLLGVSQRKVWGLADSGELPTVKVGRAKRYDRRDIEAWIERSKSVAVSG